MLDPLLVAAGGLGGTALGAGYFWSLWRSVRRLPEASRPRRVLLLGAVTRLVLVLPAIYLAARLGPEAVIGGALGFLVARGAAVRWLPERPPTARPD